MLASVHDADDADWYEGRIAIEKFHEQLVSGERWRHRAGSANGQLALGGYTFDDARGKYVAVVLDVFTLRDGLVESVTSVHHRRCPTT
jgi:RNA polymerase sigma-70 factor, ECF subfamily